MPSLTVENYVKTIYLIATQREQSGNLTVATGELAQALHVSPGSVTGMLKTLSEASLTTYAPYEGARLTPAGIRLALAVLRRHRLLELFLVQTLHMPWDEVHEEAEHLEHAASDRLIDRIEAHLGFPTVDPHGDPIPRSDGSIPTPEGRPLVGLKPGTRFHLVRVVDQDPVFLRFLTECGLDLSSRAEVVENRQGAGALILRIADRVVAMGHDAASKVLVRILPDQERNG